MPCGPFTPSLTTVRRSNLSLTRAVRLSQCQRLFVTGSVLAMIQRLFSTCFPLMVPLTTRLVLCATSPSQSVASPSTCKYTLSDHQLMRSSWVDPSTSSPRVLCAILLMLNRPSLFMIPTLIVLSQSQLAHAAPHAINTMRRSWVFTNRGANCDKPVSAPNCQ